MLVVLLGLRTSEKTIMPANFYTKEKMYKNFEILLKKILLPTNQVRL